MSVLHGPSMAFFTGRVNGRGKRTKLSSITRDSKRACGVNLRLRARESRRRDSNARRGRRRGRARGCSRVGLGLGSLGGSAAARDGRAGRPCLGAAVRSRGGSRGARRPWQRGRSEASEWGERGVRERREGERVGGGGGWEASQARAVF